MREGRALPFHSSTRLLPSERSEESEAHLDGNVYREGEP